MKFFSKTIWEYKPSFLEGFELQIKISWDFPGDAVVKNPPANAGERGSSPGLERSHMLRSN